MTFTIEGKIYQTNSEGYLKNVEDWSISVAEFLATQDQLALTKDHWTVIYLIRDYYNDNHVAPGIRRLVRAMGEKLGKNKSNSKYLYQLFPQGPAKQACKYAGLPKPTGCI